LVSTALALGATEAGASAGALLTGGGTTSALFLVGSAGNASSNCVEAEESPNEKGPKDPNSLSAACKKSAVAGEEG